MTRPINAEEVRQVVTLLSGEYSDSLSPSDLAFLQYGYLYSKFVVEPAVQGARARALAEFSAEFHRRAGVSDEQ